MYQNAKRRRLACHVTGCQQAFMFKQDYADTSRLGSQTSMKKEPLNIDRATTERKKESVFLACHALRII
jgi:hypothetical protein